LYRFTYMVNGTPVSQASHWFRSVSFVASKSECCHVAKIANALREILMARRVVHTHKTCEKPPVELAGHRRGPTVEIIKISREREKAGKHFVAAFFFRSFSLSLSLSLSLSF